MLSSHRMAMGAVFQIVLAAAGASTVVAQLADRQGASILTFPLIAHDARRDTLIELVNTGALIAYARCRYATGVTTGSAGDAQAWFSIDLSADQPTHWLVSRGRADDPDDPPCQRSPDRQTFCDGAGRDPGVVPALAAPFEGALVCVQVDRSGAPVSGNALRGAASLFDWDHGDVAKYAAVGVAGTPDNDGDAVLCLGGGERPGCSTAAEYGACPSAWQLPHLAEGAPDLVAPSAGTDHTSLSILTCSIDAPSRIAVSVTTEFESHFSTEITIDGWRRLRTDDPIFQFATAGSQHLLTRLEPVPGQPGFVLVAETDRVPNDPELATGSSAVVPPATATGVTDVIEVPAP